MSALFTLRSAVVQRASRPILSVDSFLLDEGEHVALLGPNGSGKSTFIKLLTREILPLYRDTPAVLFKGNSRFHRSKVRQSLGIVSSTMQDEIAVHIPVIDIVAGGLFASLGIPAQESEYSINNSRIKAYDALQQIGVEDLAERDIMTLSTGQARRVLIARALVHNPETLVFDEPCTGLDPEGMHHVRSTMRQLAHAGKGIVLVTHYPEDIIPEIKRIVLLKEGRVFADDSKNALLTSEIMSDLFDTPLCVKKTSVANVDNKKVFVSTKRVINNLIKKEENHVQSLEHSLEHPAVDEYFSLVSAY